MKSRAWNKYNAAVRLRRDAEMTVAFLAAHGLKDRPTRKGAELQAAEDYYRWCLTDGPEALDALDGAAVESFVEQWRLHAVAADVRAAGIGAEVRLLGAFLCLVFVIVTGLNHSFLAMSLAAALFIGLMVSLIYAKSALIVGPDGPSQLPPIAAGSTPFGWRGRAIALRVANVGRL
ncbi:hypothetical protein BTO20_38460 (plasmid) [Mycobacterium dioxanotrophicus]|uniref:Uncharacterized protein n=1 Tax=Mycobacterium dioxanotrophicus TaxID=482462 RepID=A0A1Y0CHU8_9MYCO|nr:hypothetical protein [Mycobacterium dioxanotrophicus]ART74485.1 hypothetical protein BTO20_38460 [Mycobacterium dioxanotrophicus]